MAEAKDCQINEKQKRIKDKLSNRYWRLNNLYWILDAQGNKVKFTLNAVQYAFYMALWWLNIVLKSRQHGITTFVCLYFLDACLFNSNTRAGIIAHRIDDAKRIFRDKVKFAYDNLPESIKNARKLVKDDAGELLLDNNSSIYVSVSMRSGTLQYLLISEYGYVCAHSPDKAKEIKSGALETVHAGGQITIESTAEGMGNDFHVLCEAAQKLKQSGKQLSTMDYKFHFFPWYIKPENVLPADDAGEIEISRKMQDYFEKIESVTGDKIDLPHRLWYVKKKAVLHGDIYKEHPSTPEESFMASLEGAYYGHEMIKVKEENRVGFFPCDKGFKVFTFWDIGSVHTAIWFWQFIRGEIRCIESIYDNTGIGLAEMIKSCQSKPYIYAEHYCGWDLSPLSGSNRKNPYSGQMLKDEAASLGWEFNVLPKFEFKDRIGAVRIILDKCRFNKETTEIGVAALFNYHQAKNEALSTEDKTVFNREPAPGPENHIADAFGHGALAYCNFIEINGQQIGGLNPLSGEVAEKKRDDDYSPLSLGAMAR